MPIRPDTFKRVTVHMLASYSTALMLDLSKPLRIALYEPAYGLFE